jgi:hypothetical protein
VALRTCVNICVFYDVSYVQMNTGALLNLCFYSPVFLLEQCFAISAALHTSILPATYKWLHAVASCGHRSQ